MSKNYNTFHTTTNTGNLSDCTAHWNLRSDAPVGESKPGGGKYFGIEHIDDIWIYGDEYEHSPYSDTALVLEGLLRAGRHDEAASLTPLAEYLKGYIEHDMMCQAYHELVTAIRELESRQREYQYRLSLYHNSLKERKT